MKMTINEWFLLIFLSLLWGFSFVFAEFTLQIFQPFTVGFLRVFLAGIALIAIAEFLKLAPLKTFAAHWRAFLILAFFNNFVPFTLIIWAQTVIEAGTAAILNASMPLFTLVLARFWRHEEALTVNKLCGILFGIAGVAVAIGVGGAIFAGSFAGKMAMLGACLSYGIGTNYARGFLHIPLINTAAAQSSFAALMALPLMFIFEHPFAVELALTPVLAMIGYGLFSTALAYLVYFRLLNRAGATNTSLVTLLIPVTTIVLSGWLLQEKLEAHLFAGMVLIGFGLILVDGRVFGLLGRHRQS